MAHFALNSKKTRVSERCLRASVPNPRAQGRKPENCKYSSPPINLMSFQNQIVATTFHLSHALTHARLFGSQAETCSKHMEPHKLLLLFTGNKKMPIRACSCPNEIVQTPYGTISGSQPEMRHIDHHRSTERLKAEGLWTCTKRTL